MQTRRHSFIESVTNVAIGYGVALASQLVIFPIGLWFTVISIARSYVVRRYFTRRTEA